MLNNICNIILKLLYSIICGYIIYNWKKFNTCFIFKIKIFFEYSKINRIIDI